MANPCGRERLGFSVFRRRQQAAKDRRFCITWINRMVNKEVEKRIAELRSEFFLMSLDLFEMVDENHAQWLEAMVQLLRESSLHHTTVDRDWKTSSWLRQMEEGNSEEEDAEPLDRGTKPLLVKKTVLSTFSDVFTDGDTSESETSSSETSDVSPGGDSKTSSSETSSSETSDGSPGGDSKTSSTETSSTETSDSFPDGDRKTISSETSDRSPDGDSKTISSEASDRSPDGDTSDSKTISSETSDRSPDGETSDSKTISSETSDRSPDGDSKTISSGTNDRSPDGDNSDSKTSGSETSGSETSDVTPNSDTSDSESSDVAPGGDTSSQPAESDQQETQTGTSQLMKKKEARISKNPFHQIPGSVTSEGEGQRVPMNGTNEEKALLMEREWKEWMDEQEMRGNVKTVDQRNTGEQGGAAPPTPEKEAKKKNVKGVGTVKKIRSYLGDLFNPHTYHKWERFEDED